MVLFLLTLVLRDLCACVFVSACECVCVLWNGVNIHNTYAVCGWTSRFTSRYAGNFSLVHFHHMISVIKPDFKEVNDCFTNDYCCSNTNNISI